MDIIGIGIDGVFVFLLILFVVVVEVVFCVECEIFLWMVNGMLVFGFFVVFLFM